MPMGLFVFLVFFIVLVFAMAYHPLTNKRSEKLEAFAKRLQFSFFEKVTLSFARDTHIFALCGQRSSRKGFSNLAVGKIDGVTIEIFDFSYSYTVGNREGRTIYQTVIRFTSSKVKLPYFALRPKNVIHRNHPYLGEDFIRIRGNQEFFQNYIVQTDDETAVLALFDEELCNHFARLLTKSVEGKGNQLLYYYENHLISHERMGKFLEEAMQVFNLFAAKSKVQAVLKANQYEEI